jgi:hypothetical protein
MRQLCELRVTETHAAKFIEYLHRREPSPMPTTASLRGRTGRQFCAQIGRRRHRNVERT